MASKLITLPVHPLVSKRDLQKITTLVNQMSSQSNVTQ